MEISNIVENDEIELADMEEHEVEELVSSISKEGKQIRARRKEIRYSLYRCKSEAEGKCSSLCSDEFKAMFESQPGFGGWRFFGVTWDVDITNPEIIVARNLSTEQEWDDVVRSKFPQLTPDGGITYPDITVKRKVEAESKKQEKARNRKSKK